MTTEELLSRVRAELERVGSIGDPEVINALVDHLQAQAAGETLEPSGAGSELLYTADLLRACIELENLQRVSDRIYPGTIEHAVAPVVLERLRAELTLTSAGTDALDRMTAPKEG